jgi:serine/threonine protein kinase
LKGFNNKAKDDIPKLSALLKGTPFYMAPEVIRQA